MKKLRALQLLDSLVSRYFPFTSLFFSLLPLLPFTFSYLCLLPFTFLLPFLLPLPFHLPVLLFTSFTSLYFRLLPFTSRGNWKKKRKAKGELREAKETGKGKQWLARGNKWETMGSKAGEASGHKVKQGEERGSNENNWKVRICCCFKPLWAANALYQDNPATFWNGPFQFESLEGLLAYKAKGHERDSYPAQVRVSKRKTRLSKNSALLTAWVIFFFFT